MANQNNIEWAMQAAELEELQQQNHVLFSQAAAAAPPPPPPPPPCREALRTLDDFINSINFQSSLDQFLTSIEETDQIQAHESNEGFHPPPPQTNFSTTTTPAWAATAAVAEPPVFFQPESEKVHQPPLMIPLISSMPFSVDQIWDEVMTGDQQQEQTTNLHIPPPQPQETNGWMSLMEYLMEAGVSVPRELSLPPPPSTPPQTFAPLQSFQTNNSIDIAEQDLAISNPEIPGTSLVHLNISNSEYDGGSFTCTNQQQLDINVPMEATLVVVDDDNRDEEMDMGGGRRKRGINMDGAMNVASNHSDKMKRRMIKNRETAAKSRARKQAHDAELEEKIAQLKAENCRLKKDLAEIKKKTAQVKDKRGGGKVRKLLRSSSS